jgi:hypothetical protein
LLTDLQPIAHSEADANAGPGVEAVVEVALILLACRNAHRKLTQRDLGERSLRLFYEVFICSLSGWVVQYQ